MFQLFVNSLSISDQFVKYFRGAKRRYAKTNPGELFLLLNKTKVKLYQILYSIKSINQICRFWNSSNRLYTLLTPSPVKIKIRIGFYLPGL